MIVEYREHRGMYSVVSNEKVALRPAMAIASSRSVAALESATSAKSPLPLQACGFTNPTRPVQSIGCDGALPALSCRVLRGRHYGIKGSQQCRHRTLHGVCRPAGHSVLEPSSCRPQDEPFHAPQAQAYCNGEWTTWDPKITTPPGLYVPSNSCAPPRLTWILQIRVERHPEAYHNLQMQLTCIAVSAAVDFAGTPVYFDTSALLP